jgi:hypothetical protein
MPNIILVPTLIYMEGPRGSEVGLKNYATSRGIAGSNPVKLIGFSINLILPAALRLCG